ncbi:MAG: HD domain-containing protein [Desulfobacterales bacterium]|nr:HD domain-containing protein [Desulfobacterales bacterium]
MKSIANLLFEIRLLSDITRSGYAFLGSGDESIAEHSFTTAFICFAMARLEPDLDRERLISMALVHDIPEARIGDFNYVQKKYATADEERAVADMTRNLPFGDEIRSLIQEFNGKKTREAQLANDADQLSFILELKKLKDNGAKPPEYWIPTVEKRLKTDLGKEIGKSLLATRWDEWWMTEYSE